VLNKIFLSNFQGYRGSKSIELAPLTLIFGPNSGGKSSLIRSLLLLKQSLASSDPSVADLSYLGQSVNLVGFPNVVFGHNTKDKVLVGFELSNSWRLEQLQGVSVRYEVDEIGLKVILLDYEIGIIGEDQEQIPEDKRTGRITIRLEPQKSKEESDAVNDFEVTGGLWSAVRIDNSELLDALLLSVGRTLNKVRKDREGAPKEADLSGPESNDAYISRGEVFWKEVFSNLSLRYLLPNDRGAGMLGLRKRDNEHPDSATAKWVLAILLNTGNAAITSQFGGITHLDPLREIPARIEVEQAPTEQISSAAKSEALKKVSGWIEKLTEGRFSLDSSESYLMNANFLGNVKTRLLVDNHTGTKVSFQDVGVGLSQVEPILTALEQAIAKKHKGKGIASRIGRSSRTLLIQQPELHLHPKMQSDLMNVFVEAVNTPESRIQIIAETHSENMVLRLQRKIREGEISIDQVCVLYAEKDPDGEGNRISRLELDSDGQFISSWPMSFLDIRLDDLL